MEIRELNTFLQVARLKSFSKAAAKLGYSQAAVTIQVKHLEKELGTRLFDRMGKQTTLTYHGQVLYHHASGILKEVSQVKEKLAQHKGLNGQLRIGAIESICASLFPALVRQYHMEHPEVTVSIRTDSPGRLLDMMNHNEVDMVYFLDKKMYDANWVKVMEKQEEVDLVCSASHPMAFGKEASLEEVVGQPFILTEQDASYRLMLEQYLLSQGKVIRPFLELGNTDLIIRLVEENLGLSFLPRFSVEPGLKRGLLSVLHVPGFPISAWRQMVYHKDKWVTGEMEAFIQLATGFCK